MGLGGDQGRDELGLGLGRVGVGVGVGVRVTTSAACRIARSAVRVKPPATSPVVGQG